MGTPLFACEYALQQTLAIALPVRVTLALVLGPECAMSKACRSALVCHTSDEACTSMHSLKHEHPCLPGIKWSTCTQCAQRLPHTTCGSASVH
eukprot:1157736-Pelagomonas_calceolata.AAC.3